MTAASKPTNASNDRPTRPKRKQPTNSHKLDGLSQLTPYAQGELDSLCGLYSIINAIRLVLYPAGVPADRGVVRRGVGPQLAQVPEHGDAAPGC